MTILRRLAAFVVGGRAALLGPATLMFDVAPGTCSVFDDARGVQIRCLAGRLWLTHEGQYEDIELRPGDIAQIGFEGKTLVLATESARFAAHGAWRPASPGTAASLSAAIEGLPA